MLKWICCTGVITPVLLAGETSKVLMVKLEPGNRQGFPVRCILWLCGFNCNFSGVFI